MSNQPSEPIGSTVTHEDIRTGLSADAIRLAVLDHLHYMVGKIPENATRNDWYMALAYAVRDRMVRNWANTLGLFFRKKIKVVGYLSAEFLMGPQLGNSLINLGIFDQTRDAVAQLGLDLADLIEQEVEPGLGNGGLGRLAACYMDSLATLGVPAIGYGIRYEFGIFDQIIRDAGQVESTDKWLRYGNPWELQRPELAYTVNLGGHTEADLDQQGRYRVRWVPHRQIKGIACDTPLPGYKSPVTDLLRLWKAEAVESFDFRAFNVGDYYGAVDAKMRSETISKVLYPNDEPEIGKILRLAQQYFFVSCSLQDMIHIHLIREKSLLNFHETVAFQLNDTHPSIAIAELMRLCVDEHLMDWDTAWEITRKTFAYTNHTLLPEALEKWPLPLFKEVLPRHLEIIYEINRRFLDDVGRLHPGDNQRAARLSIVDEKDDRYVRMAHLAAVGSHHINGVAALHSGLLTKDVMRDFYELTPEKFLNVTNGVTPRRWILLSNPRLADLITRRIGPEWVWHLEARLKDLESCVDDAEFRREWREVKRSNKVQLAALLRDRTGVAVDPDSMFDVQVKRIHEYKRQHLNLLHVITLYNRIRKSAVAGVPPRTVIFGGKAAPGYFMAKLIIRLICAVGETINRDEAAGGLLKVVFLPNFNVKNGMRVYPAADLSEQISTAGKEASGTGNMKFSMNGALTIGTLDGANVEIREEVGEENFFLFGMTAEQVAERAERGYSPEEHYHSNSELKETIDLISSGFFSKGDATVFQPLVDSLLRHDPFMVLADYQAYVECQEQVSRAYLDLERWTRMSILNTARMGTFSSDRSIREYCEKIWNVPVRR